MSHTVLVYGATRFSGRLIAAEGRYRGMANVHGTPEPRMILAGRDGYALKELATQLGMEYRVFELDDADEVKRGLRDTDVVINAAGPFGSTAEPLALGAIAARSHYVDINGEVEVYKALKRRVQPADVDPAPVAVVCSAGYTPAASDVMLNAALRELNPRDLDWGAELGSVHIALSCTPDLSRGTAETIWRALREDVQVVRRTWLATEPVGKLERTFDFRKAFHGDDPAKRDLRVATAANLVDTLTARRTGKARRFVIRNIESYVEAGPIRRIAYQAGAMLAPFSHIRPVDILVQQQIKLLPPGPTDEELEHDREMVVLEIEDPVRTRLVHWRWETPNAYQFTAQVVVEIARRLTGAGVIGWRTPGTILQPHKAQLTAMQGVYRNCELSERLP
jgi:short subunit dehydrogenase-like uncharacterized protein